MEALDDSKKEANQTYDKQPKVHYPRKRQRVGYQYQAKIPALLKKDEKARYTRPTTALKTPEKENPAIEAQNNEAKHFNNGEKNFKCIHKKSNQQEDFLAHVSNLFTSQEKNSLNENDEKILEFLTIRHHGNVKAAKLDLHAHLSSGEAKKHRKAKKVKLNSTQFKDNKHEDFQAWKISYKEFQQTSSSPSLWGDFRSLMKEHGFQNRSSIMISSWKSKVLETNIKNEKPEMNFINDLLYTAYTSSDVHISADITKALYSLLELLSQGLDYQCKILDAIYPTPISYNTSEHYYIYNLSKIQSQIEVVSTQCPIILHEVKIISTILEKALDWDTKTYQLLNKNNNISSEIQQQLTRENTLLHAENLMYEAKNSLSIYSSAVIDLSKKVLKAHEIRNKIKQWDHLHKTDKNRSYIRNVVSLTKECNKIGFIFPEASMINAIHKTAEDWNEQATRAMRFKISLSMLDEIITEGEQLPFNVTEVLDRLKSKKKNATDWIVKFHRIVMEDSSGENFLTSNKKEDLIIEYKITFLQKIRSRLNDHDPDVVNKFTSHKGALIKLFNEGLRIPVDITEWNLLKFELDAFDWSFETKKMLKQNGNKKPKLEEYLTQLDKAKKRHKLPVERELKKSWMLDFEQDLLDLIDSANNWLDEVYSYFGDPSESNSKRAEEDSRSSKKNSPTTISILELCRLHAEAEKMPVNLGPGLVRLNKAMSEILPWLQQNAELLSLCGIIDINKYTALTKLSSKYDSSILLSGKSNNVTLSIISSALSSVPSIDTDIIFSEAIKLRPIFERVQKWSEKAVKFRSRSKRHSKNSSPRNVEEIVELLKECAKFPLFNFVCEEKERLEMQLQQVKAWQLNAQCELRLLTEAFIIFQQERDDSIALETEQGFELVKALTMASKAGNLLPNISSGSGTIVTVGREKVCSVINSLIDSSLKLGISTIEEKIAEYIDNSVINWCCRVANILPHEVLHKCNFDELDEIICQGRELLKQKTRSMIEDKFYYKNEDLKAVLEDLDKSWATLVEKELIRLNALRRKRDEYSRWANKAEKVLNSAVKPNLETLFELVRKSNSYPGTLEPVRKVRKELENKEWDIWKVETQQIRRLFVQMFKTSTDSIVQITKRWLKSELRKSHRKNLFQKYQKKVNKERRDLDKKTHEAEVLTLRAIKECNLSLDSSSIVLPSEGAEARVEINPEAVLSAANTKGTIKSSDLISHPGENVIGNLEKLKSQLVTSTTRLENLLNDERALMLQFVTEEEELPSLEQWFDKVRTVVLSPASQEEAKDCRPKSNGSLSGPMIKLKEEAKALKINDFTDVKSVIDEFHNLSWHLSALDLFCRKPSMEEIESLLTENQDHLGEKVLRELNNFHEKSLKLKEKVANALAPIEGETEPFNLDMLLQLYIEIKSFSVKLVEESLLLNTINDNGKRHCICGGPSDGRFMLSCDKCELWFHGECVKLQSSQNSAVSYWLCPRCESTSSKDDLKVATESKKNKKTMTTSSILQKTKRQKTIVKEHVNRQKKKLSDVDQVWPPLGLSNSSDATSAFENLNKRVSKLLDTLDIG